MSNIKAPPKKRRGPHFNRHVYNNDFMDQRYSAIIENKTISRRGSQQQYMGRRNQALRSIQNDQTQQDATILATMSEHEEYQEMDTWSLGRQHSHREAYTTAKQVALQIKPDPIAKPPNIHHDVNPLASLPEDVNEIQQPPNCNSKFSADIYDDMETETFKPSCCVHLIVFILISVLCGAAFYYYYLYEWPDKIYYKMSYAAILWFLCTLFLFLNIIDKFHPFHECFAACCCRKGAMIFTTFTIVFGIIEYILWSLYEEELLLTESYIGSEKIFISLIVIDVIYYLCYLFLFCAAMSAWPTISYYISESLWIHALLHMSVIGYILIWFCRKLRPPTVRMSWHGKHDSYVLWCSIMKVTSWLFLIFNILFGCVTPLFGEGVRYVALLGTEYAIGGYVGLAFSVMLTPLMPGSLIDIAGGFLFVFVLVENHAFDIWLAWLIAVFSIILLHYCGACAQWLIGSVRAVQFYLNSTLPPELLAASDSVLEDANCGTVGLIGYVFLDTANGLNQGRINMKFWTQLCSEWSCIPNAFAVVSLGATIALPAIYPEQYEAIKNKDTDTDVNSGSEQQYLIVLMDILIPLLALIAGIIQFSGLSLAARTLGKSIDSDDYMMNREKWSAVQFFYKVSGFVPSTNGWMNDVLQLSKPNTEYPEKYQKSLFTDVIPLQRWYQKRIKTHKSQERLAILEKYRMELDSIRNVHYTTIEAQYDSLINDRKWLISPTTDNELDIYEADAGFYFSKQNIIKHKNRKIAQVIITIVFLITFWVSFYRIYWQAAFFDRVAKGFAIFRETTEWYDWISFSVFLCAWTIYNQHAIKKNMKNIGKQLCFVLKCCRINKNIESRFNTPDFDTTKFDKDGNCIPQSELKVNDK